ncbi:DUF2637 domain-containing protein [Streptomyces marianii]|uniref:DUF2637 domain-containing protein n=1 Tax=Streptomyces marianii TaxID=1817406 RepID=A0A5R9E840_9ACTN|nr:DUF2637 domain-containing protein [Streptomyces marianii]TLQ46221.1 DUF2637 domain-containing protein [Streptomyces marianii]
MFRKVRLDAVLVQAVIAGALSFAHLHDLAAAAGQDGWKAWAYPVSVDLLLVAAWRRLRLLRDQGEPARAAWSWFAVALAASLGANVATAGLLDLNDVPDWLRILVAGWPALAFLGGTLLVHTPTTPTTAATDGVKPEPLPVVEPVTVPAQPEHAPQNPAAMPVPDAVEPAEPVPALPAAPPADVPPALVDHARKLADSHRASTGTPIDAATLRDRLGLPGPMADQLAAHLT